MVITVRYLDILIGKGCVPQGTLKPSSVMRPGFAAGIMYSNQFHTAYTASTATQRHQNRKQGSRKAREWVTYEAFAQPRPIILGKEHRNSQEVGHDNGTCRARVVEAK